MGFRQLAPEATAYLGHDHPASTCCTRISPQPAIQAQDTRCRCTAATTTRTSGSFPLARAALSAPFPARLRSRSPACRRRLARTHEGLDQKRRPAHMQRQPHYWFIGWCTCLLAWPPCHGCASAGRSGALSCAARPSRTRCVFRERLSGRGRMATAPQASLPLLPVHGGRAALFIHMSPEGRA